MPVGGLHAGVWNPDEQCLLSVGMSSRENQVAGKFPSQQEIVLTF